MPAQTDSQSRQGDTFALSQPAQLRPMRTQKTLLYPFNHSDRRPSAHLWNDRVRLLTPLCVPPPRPPFHLDPILPISARHRHHPPNLLPSPPSPGNTLLSPSRSAPPQLLTVPPTMAPTPVIILHPIKSAAVSSPSTIIQTLTRLASLPQLPTLPKRPSMSIPPRLATKSTIPVRSTTSSDSFTTTSVTTSTTKTRLPLTPRTRGR